MIRILLSGDRAQIDRKAVRLPLRWRWRNVGRTIATLDRCPRGRTAAELADVHRAKRKQKLRGERRKRQPRHYRSIRSEPIHGCEQKSFSVTNSTKLDGVVEASWL
jgi:hypothetical protein